MTSNQTVLALDIGTRRIGVARADKGVAVAYPLTTLTVDGNEQLALKQLIGEVQPSVVVVGYPRNQSGSVTEQTALVEAYVAKLGDLGVPVVFQDESLTSVMAEQRLGAAKTAEQKAAIDAEAASIILQDYLEQRYGH